jgi:hypothetical protein
MISSNKSITFIFSFIFLISLTAFAMQPTATADYSKPPLSPSIVINSPMNKPITVIPSHLM